MRKMRWLLGGADLITSVLACGSEADLAHSGAPRDALVAELSQEDTRKLCVWLYEFEQRRSMKAECTAYAAMNATSQSECEQQRDMCLAEKTPLREQRSEAALAACRVLEAPPSEEACWTSVAELEQCARDTVQTRLAYVRRFTCETPGRFRGDWYPPETCNDVSLSCFLLDE